MTERPEFVPVFLQSATDIKEFLLSQIPDTWRKEVGDFPYDMIMPDVAQIMQLEIAQDRTLQNAFPQFCEDERMDEHMEIRGLTRIEATANKRVLSIVADPGVRIPQGYTFTSVVTDEEGNPIEFTADREQSVGLPMLPNSDYATRRPKVLARLQNYENFGAPMIHRIAEAYGEKIRVYIDPAECLVTIVFQRGVPTFLEEFKKAVDNIIHAHMGTEYKFEYIITGGLEMLTQYHVYGYNVPEAGASAICGTLPFTATEGRLYSASLGVSGKVDTVLRDYDQTGTIASGPLPFVSTEGRVYRTVIAEAVDGTYTIETYKQSSEATETGTIPSVTTEGRIYSAVMSVEESDAVTSTRYVQAGEMETGDKRL